jgi:hypothetical protein
MPSGWWVIRSHDIHISRSERRAQHLPDGGAKAGAVVDGGYCRCRSGTKYRSASESERGSYRSCTRAISVTSRSSCWTGIPGHACSMRVRISPHVAANRSRAPASLRRSITGLTVDASVAPFSSSGVQPGRRRSRTKSVLRPPGQPSTPGAINVVAPGKNVGVVANRLKLSSGTGR